MTKVERFKLWLARKFRDWAERLETQHPAYQTALGLAKGWSKNNTVGGEYKRHRVYADLIDLYPTMSRKDIGLLIERVVQTLP
jgi:hypothetical protein